MNSWFLLLLVISISVAWVDSQVDSKGFINIDCGRDPNTSFYNSVTKSTYVSDDQFIDTGENHGIDSRYALQNQREELLTVRSFPSGTRNCYTLRSLRSGSKYLVRADFFYGNYDNLNELPTFDVHLGVNYWKTIEMTTPNSSLFTEIIATATSDYLQVCLVNTKLGTPFISYLHLSELKPTMYKLVNSTQSLVYSHRRNMGENDELRYPDDPYDRIWKPYAYTSNGWKNISTNSTVKTDTDFETPSAVLQTAVTTLTTTQPLNFSWSSDNTSDFFVIIHFSEIGVLTSTDVRQFDILSNGFPVLNEPFVPQKLESGWVQYTNKTYNDYNVSLRATSNSTLPPLLNAFELYIITAATGIPTNNGDVTAINSIKMNYKVKKDWTGDPCVPKDYAWTGATCTSDSTNIPRITALDLSSSGLTGAIISSFGNLSSLKSLDLSNNDLTGDVPAFLDNLSSLTYLDITGNKNLSTTLPPGLQSKRQNGSLNFRHGDNGNKRNNQLVIISVVVGMVVLLLIVATIIIVVLYLRKFSNAPEVNSSEINNVGQHYANITKTTEAGHRILDFENRRYCYNDLVRITKKFENHIGTGGFGSVYLGVLDDGTHVAVKTRSHSSKQGVKEFLAEAQNLSRVHHRNLVSLIGYCMDEDCMALVYEYMKEGTLQHKLKDNSRPLSWNQRVRIAYESALGLEYLHKACNPPLIHRDVKTSNILLNENLEAKIADFGLSREFNSVASTHVSREVVGTQRYLDPEELNDVAYSHVSTTVVGTRGYLDPEYHSLNQLSKKSDVYSFGVVLLETITGKPPILEVPRISHLKEWVNEELSRGYIENIVDPVMQEQYNRNSALKVIELARKCTNNSAAQRPTMSMVVRELTEILDMEVSTEGTHGNRAANYKPYNYSSDEKIVNGATYNVFQLGYTGSMSISCPEGR